MTWTKKLFSPGEKEKGKEKDIPFNDAYGDCQIQSLENNLDG